MEREARPEELMIRVARGEKAALGELYDRFSGAALGLALRILKDRQSAEEVVQESFWRVWRRAQSYDPTKRFSTWLLTIVHNLAIDQVRRRGGLPPSIELDASTELASEIPDAEMDVPDRAWSGVVAVRVREAVARLPDAQRLVIEQAYFDGLTHQEIATRLGEPLGTIHTRARLGLQKLKEELDDLRETE